MGRWAPGQRTAPKAFKSLEKLITVMAGCYCARLSCIDILGSCRVQPFDFVRQMCHDQKLDCIPILEDGFPIWNGWPQTILVHIWHGTNNILTLAHMAWVLAWLFWLKIKFQLIWQSVTKSMSQSFNPLSIRRDIQHHGGMAILSSRRLSGSVCRASF